MKDMLSECIDMLMNMSDEEFERRDKRIKLNSFNYENELDDEFKVLSYEDIDKYQMYYEGYVFQSTSFIVIDINMEKSEKFMNDTYNEKSVIINNYSDTYYHLEKPIVQAPKKVA